MIIGIKDEKAVIYKKTDPNEKRVKWKHNFL